MINIADRRLDDLRKLGHDRSIRNLLDRLRYDARGLTHFFDAHHVPVVGVARFAYRDSEVEVGVYRIWFGLAYVPLDAGASQRRPRNPQIDRFLSGNHSHTASAPYPDAVFGQQRFVFIDV